MHVSRAAAAPIEAPALPVNLVKIVICRKHLMYVYVCMYIYIYIYMYIHT